VHGQPVNGLDRNAAVNKLVVSMSKGIVAQLPIHARNESANIEVLELKLRQQDHNKSSSLFGSLFLVAVGSIRNLVALDSINHIAEQLRSKLMQLLSYKFNSRIDVAYLFL
jgi:hypothetical protein